MASLCTGQAFFPPTGQRRHAFSRLALAVGVLSILAPALPQTASAAEATKLKVGFSPSYGIISSSSHGHGGYGFEVLRAVAQHTGWEYEFLEADWDENLRRLKTGEIDLLTTLQISPERSKLFDFSAYPVGYEYGVMYVRDDNTTVSYDEYATFDGLRLGVMRSNFINTLFRKLERKNGFKTRWVYFENAVDLLQALENGSVDAIVTGSLQNVSNVRMVSRFSVDPFYIATTKGNTKVISDLNAALEAMRIDNVYYDAELYAKFFQCASVNQPSFSRSEQDYIAKSPPLKMGYQTHWEPLEFTAADGTFGGIGATLMRKLEAVSGLTFEYVPVASYIEGLAALESGQLDLMSGLAPGHTNDITGILHTRPYLQVPLVVVGKGEGLDVAKPRMAIPNRALHMLHFAQDQYPSMVLMPMKGPEACLDAVRQGRAQMAFLTAYYYNMLNNTGSFDDIHLVSMSAAPLPLVVGIRPGHPPLLRSVLDKALTRISEGDVQNAVFSNTKNELANPSLAEILRKHAVLLWWLMAGVLLVAVASYVIVERRSRRLLWKAAYIDPLTGYHNWNKLERDRLAAPWTGPYVCAFIDIDDFKLINHYFGYEEGTRVLQHMAQCIRGGLAPGEACARRDADIFILVLRDGTDADLKLRLGKMFAHVADLPFLPDQEAEHRPLNIACGICRVDDPSLSFHEACDRANSARKSIKPLHTHTVAFFDEDMLRQLEQVREIELRMNEALQREEFEVYFQPKVLVADGHIIGAEALVRWNHPQHGLMSPQFFVPVFENNGFVIKLDMYVLLHVCRSLRSWLDQGYTPVPVSVNFSKIHILRTSFVDNVQSILELYNVPPELIEMEFTESAFLSNEDTLLHCMERLRGHGFTLSLDDFGAGYSSLNMLKNMPVQVLKLDKGFFDTSGSKRGKQVFSSIIHMAKALHIYVLSEGVETPEQAAFLREAGCDFAQGFYFARPMRQSSFEKLLFDAGHPCLPVDTEEEEMTALENMVLHTPV